MSQSWQKPGRGLMVKPSRESVYLMEQASCGRESRGERGQEKKTAWVEGRPQPCSRDLEQVPL